MDNPAAVANMMGLQVNRYEDLVFYLNFLHLSMKLPVPYVFSDV